MSRRHMLSHEGGREREDAASPPESDGTREREREGRKITITPVRVCVYPCSRGRASLLPFPLSVSLSHQRVSAQPGSAVREGKRQEMMQEDETSIEWREREREELEARCRY